MIGLLNGLLERYVQIGSIRLIDAKGREYIFPGGYMPSLSEVFAAVEPTGLTVTDVEILRLHYAKTLAAWYVRFQANRDRVAALFDERFCRMWEFYLLSSEIGFRYGGQMVFQMQLAKALETLPITRDYMSQQETNGMSC